MDKVMVDGACTQCGATVDGWNVEEHLDEPRLETFVPATAERVTLSPCGHGTIRPVATAR